MCGKCEVVTKFTWKQEQEGKRSQGECHTCAQTQPAIPWSGGGGPGSGTGVSLTSSRWVSLSDGGGSLSGGGGSLSDGGGSLSDGGKEDRSYCGGR